MKLLFSIIFFQIICCCEVSAQLYNSDARDMAMGNASVACLPTSGFSKNMAFIPQERKSFLCMNVMNKYFIKDLSPVFLSFIKSFNGTFSVNAGIGRMGNDKFSEQMIETGIAKKLSDKFFAGIKIEYHQWAFSDGNYSNSHTFIPSVGLYTNPIKNLSLGVIIRNPVRSRMNAIETNKLPAQINPGFSLKVSEKIKIACSVTQQNDRPLATQFGMEYSFHPRLFFRCGWQTVPVSESFGFALLLDRMFIDLSLQTHPLLGNSYSMAITFPI